MSKEIIRAKGPSAWGGGENRDLRLTLFLEGMLSSSDHGAQERFKEQVNFLTGGNLEELGRLFGRFMPRLKWTNSSGGRFRLGGYDLGVNIAEAGFGWREVASGLGETLRQGREGDLPAFLRGYLLMKDKGDNGLTKEMWEWLTSSPVKVEVDLAAAQQDHELGDFLRVSMERMDFLPSAGFERVARWLLVLKGPRFFEAWGKMSDGQKMILRQEGIRSGWEGWGRHFDAFLEVLSGDCFVKEGEMAGKMTEFFFSQYGPGGNNKEMMRAAAMKLLSLWGKDHFFSIRASELAEGGVFPRLVNGVWGSWFLREGAKSLSSPGEKKAARVMVEVFRKQRGEGWSLSPSTAEAFLYNKPPFQDNDSFEEVFRRRWKVTSWPSGQKAAWREFLLEKSIRLAGVSGRWVMRPERINELLYGLGVEPSELGSWLEEDRRGSWEERRATVMEFLTYWLEEKMVQRSDGGFEAEEKRKFGNEARVAVGLMRKIFPGGWSGMRLGRDAGNGREKRCGRWSQEGLMGKRLIAFWQELAGDQTVFRGCLEEGGLLWLASSLRRLGEQFPAQVMDLMASWPEEAWGDLAFLEERRGWRGWGRVAESLAEVDLKARPELLNCLRGGLAQKCGPVVLRNGLTLLENCHWSFLSPEEKTNWGDFWQVAGRFKERLGVGVRLLDGQTGRIVYAFLGQNQGEVLGKRALFAPLLELIKEGIGGEAETAFKPKGGSERLAFLGMVLAETLMGNSARLLGREKVWEVIDGFNEDWRLELARAWEPFIEVGDKRNWEGWVRLVAGLGDRFKVEGLGELKQAELVKAAGELWEKYLFFPYIKPSEL